MKYMILTFASQQNYEEMVGKPSAEPAWSRRTSPRWGRSCERSTRSCSTRANWSRPAGLSAPVHTRRVGLRRG